MNMNNHDTLYVLSSTRTSLYLCSANITAVTTSNSSCTNGVALSLGKPTATTTTKV